MEIYYYLASAHDLKNPGSQDIPNNNLRDKQHTPQARLTPREAVKFNGNVHRAAAKNMQAKKVARPAAACATYCYHAVCSGMPVGQQSN